MEYKMVYRNPISRWEEALPLGNGQMGCLIWGGAEKLRFSLDRVDVWDTSQPGGTDSPEFTYENLVKLARGKNTAKIREIFDAPYNFPTPTKLPVGKIFLHFPGYAGVESELALENAQACLSLEEGKGANGGRRSARIRSIVHATLGVGIIQVKLPADKFSVELSAPEFGREGRSEDAGEYDALNRSISQGSLLNIVYPEAERSTLACGEGGYIEYFRQKTNTEFAFGVIMGVAREKEETRIYYRIVTTADGGEAFEEGIERIRRLMDCGYDQLLEEHESWWRAFWEESSIVLPDKRMEQSWYVSNYLLASCSRRGFYPMPLQGVWTADEDILPPWKGDYHNDLNTQMSYYSYLKANHVEQGECFVDFLWKRRREGEEFARVFYGTGGLCLPAVMTIDGKPLGGWPMYSLSPVNQIWLCQAFDRHYLYTGDEEFLAQRAYPYFQETEECIGALLREGPDGMLYLPVSSSPEIHDDEAGAFLTPNSNYDLALLHYLYKTLLAYAQRLKESGLLDIDGRKLDDWEEKRRKLPPLAVDERGVLMLSPDEILRESHRHFSHAHAVHPLRLLKYDTPENQRVIDAVIKDLEQLGTSMWVGFSFCWMAELYAVARKGEKAAEQLRLFWEYFCSSNGFHLNGDYKKKGYSTFDYHPFTLEANMCAADALQEMLLYSQEGVIEPFPAIPEEWEEEGTSFGQLRAEGGILVGADVRDGRLTGLILDAPGERRVIIRGWDREGRRNRDAEYPVTLRKGLNRIGEILPPET